MSFPNLLPITYPSLLATPANFVCNLMGFPLFYFLLGSVCHKMAVGSNVSGEVLRCIVVSASGTAQARTNHAEGKNWAIGEVCSPKLKARSSSKLGWAAWVAPA